MKLRLDTGNKASDIYPLIQQFGNGTHTGEISLADRPYEMDISLEIPNGVHIVGDWWAKQPWQTWNRKGTIFWASGTQHGNIKLKGWSSGIHNCMFIQNQDPYGPGWTPREHHWFVEMWSDDHYISNCLFDHCTRGITQRWDIGFSGRCKLEWLWMHCFECSIDLWNYADVPYLNNIHIWPFGQQNSYGEDWERANSTGLRMRRVDNPSISNLFTIWKNKGIHLTTGGAGSVSSIKGTNLEFDAGGYGIYIDQSNSQRHMINGLKSNGDGQDGSMAIRVIGNNNQMTINGLGTRPHHKNCVRIDGNDNYLRINGGMIEDWDTVRLGYPALECVGGSNSIIDASDITFKYGGSNLIGWNGKVNLYNFRRI